MARASGKPGRKGHRPVVNVKVVGAELDEAIEDLDGVIDEADHLLVVGVDEPEELSPRGWLTAVLWLGGVIGLCVLLDQGCRLAGNAVGTVLGPILSPIFDALSPLGNWIGSAVSYVDNLGTRMNAGVWIGRAVAVGFLAAGVWMILFIIRLVLAGPGGGGGGRRTRRGGGGSGVHVELGTSTVVEVDSDAADLD